MASGGGAASPTGSDAASMAGDFFLRDSSSRSTSSRGFGRSGFARRGFEARRALTPSAGFDLGFASDIRPDNDLQIKRFHGLRPYQPLIPG